MYYTQLLNAVSVHKFDVHTIFYILRVGLIIAYNSLTIGEHSQIVCTIFIGKTIYF